MSTRNAIATLFALVCLGQASSALAVTCTLNGSLRYQPADNYYCDTNHFSAASCTGWREVNIDSGDQPMKYMLVEIRTTQNGAPAAITHTNSSGTFSVAIPNLPSCSTSVWVAPKYRRIHESDLAVGSPRYRFRLTDINHSDLSSPMPAPLNGTPTSSWSNIMARAQNDIHGRAHAVYYTMNSAVTEIVTWSTNLSTRLASSNIASVQKVMVDSSLLSESTTSASSAGDGTIALNWDAYRRGGTIRHELGHWIHQLTHNRAMTASCYSDAYNNVTNHDVHTCEYGYTATIEAMATFFAVRSITSADQNAWHCKSTSTTQDRCNNEIADTTDSDGVTLSWSVIGDRIANAVSKCVTLDSASCGCGASCGTQAWKDGQGFRVETQIARFFWDMLDANNDSGLDDTNITMSTLVGVIQGMSCTGAVDGSCNEANVNPCTAGKRDAYNVYDYDQLIANNQSGERTLNCVTGAIDIP